MSYKVDEKLPEQFLVNTPHRKSQYVEETFKGHKKAV